MGQKAPEAIRRLEEAPHNPGAVHSKGQAAFTHALCRTVTPVGIQVPKLTCLEFLNNFVPGLEGESCSCKGKR